ncbi:MAG: DUF3617 domain-containing protein [Pseudazoarcus pumilus]|nr:DUF3617 domain-containing protein [Pseudazoarcus pumilus]
MQRTLALMLFATALPALANPIPPNMPKPEAGLWEMKTTVAEMGGMAMTFESCMGGSVEELLARPEVENADCKDMKVDYSANRMTARATCTIEGSRAVIVSEFTGDFRRGYRGQVRSTYTPPLHGMQQTTANVEGRWVAPACLPGQKPGDSRMKGGMNIPGVGNIDLDALMKNMPGAAR